MDADFLAECYRTDAERPKDMSPDMVSFMLEADELTDAFLQAQGGGDGAIESVHDRLARMRREQGEDDDPGDVI